MAIYHMHSQVISRSSGRSVVAAIAYRAAEKVHDERLGQTFDYSRKQGVAHSEILAPENAPAWMRERATLWNGADAAEKRKDAQMAREVQVALPMELSKNEQIAVLREFITDNFVSRGMVADYSLHHDNPENPHAHILLTTRSIEGDGFGKKCRAWNDKSLYGSWREEWARSCNRGLDRAGHDIRIDHRSYAEQGIALEPTVHIGKDRARAERDTDGYVTQERLAEHDRIVRENGEAIVADPSIALDAITKQQATFTRSQVGRWLHSRTLDADQFNRALSAVMSHESVVALGVRDNYGNERFTTERMQRIERGMVDQALELHGQSRHKVDDALVTQAFRAQIDRGAALSKEQRLAVRHVCGRHDIAVVEGYAGAGKSHMLGVAREAWEAQGYRVLGAALAGKAAEGLEVSAGISSRTLASYERSWERGYDRLTKSDVLVVDEAGMLGTEQMTRLVAEVRRAHAKLVLVGDTQQLQAIDAGAPMRAIGTLVGVTRLEDIRRQKVDWQREASVQLAQGDIPRGLNAYHEHGHLHEYATQREAMEAMVNAWDAARSEHPEQIQIMLAFRRQEVADLNALARERLQRAGELGRAEKVQTLAGARMFAEGDRVYFLQNNRDLDVKNGSLGTVEELRDGQMVVRLDGQDERRVAFDTRIYDALDHGYAATVHKAQGVTVDRAKVLPSQLFDRNVTYVGMTRHTTQADMYWSREEFSSPQQAIGAMARERPKDLALDYDDVAREADRLRQEANDLQETLRREKEERSRTYDSFKQQQATQRAQESQQGQEKTTNASKPSFTSREEMQARVEREKAYQALVNERAEVVRRLDGCERTTFEQEWQKLPEVQGESREWFKAEEALANAKAKEERLFQRESANHPGVKEETVRGWLWMHDENGKVTLAAEAVNQAQRKFEAAETRWEALAADQRLDVVAERRVAEINQPIEALEKRARALAVALEKAEPQHQCDVAVQERDAAFLAKERQAIEQRGRDFFRLRDECWRTQAEAQKPSLNRADLWRDQPEVRALLGERQGVEYRLRSFEHDADAFRRMHPIKAKLGMQPQVRLLGREMGVFDAVEESKRSLAHVNRQIEALKSDPKVLNRVDAIIREHDATVRTAQRRLPTVESALKAATHQREIDTKALKLGRELDDLNRGISRTHERERSHSRGMGLGR